MSMDYSQAANAQLQPPHSPELGLKAAAERVARATNNVENFLTRFHGPMPESANGTGGAVSDNYRNDLDSLFTALDRLEGAVVALDRIG
jgi:hypothetical protein